jgi:hypothetical protein
MFEARVTGLERRILFTQSAPLLKCARQYGGFGIYGCLRATSCSAAANGLFASRVCLPPHLSWPVLHALFHFLKMPSLFTLLHPTWLAHRSHLIYCILKASFNSL